MIMYLSLGSDCSVAYNLQLLNLKNETYPFDWITSKSFKDIVNCLKNNFTNLLEIDNYIPIGESNNHQLILDDHFLIENSQSLIVANTINDFKFFHDSYATDISNFTYADEKFHYKI